MNQFSPGRNPALLTDLYELKMAFSYFEHKQNCLASFDLFIRDLPKERSFFLAAGLNDVVEFLKEFHFDDESIQYLKSLKIFSDDFLEFLRSLKFKGSLWAVREGTVVFPNEPIIRIVAPLIEAQIIESFLLNIINLQTTIATKAARIILAAKGRSVFDFSLRRTHGLDAALKAARVSYLAGFSGTSNTLAGKIYQIPVAGTMAHSFVMSFGDEINSFRAFVKTFPASSTLLVDTYNTLKGVGKAVIVAKELEKKGFRLAAIRLDSGNLVTVSQKARSILDKAGLPYIKIFASGNLDEYHIKELVDKKAPIDSFGVGTKMGVSADAPYSDVIYKLSEIADSNGEFLPTMKLSQGKVTYPGRKQVFRFSRKDGVYQKDIIALEEEHPGGVPLLMKVIDNGVVVYNSPPLKEMREFALNNLSKLPKEIKNTAHQGTYRVQISPQLKELTARVSKRIRRQAHQ